MQQASNFTNMNSQILSGRTPPVLPTQMMSQAHFNSTLGLNQLAAQNYVNQIAMNNQKRYGGFLNNLSAQPWELLGH